MRNKKQTPQDIILIIMQFCIFPSFLYVGYFRVKYNNSSLVNYINIGSCFLAICTVIISAHIIYNDRFKPYKKKSWISKLFIIFYIVAIIFFSTKIMNEHQYHYLSPSWSDFYSILALGISLSNDILARVLNCLLEYVVNIIYGIK